jgi:hypothetical protein
MDQDDEKLFHRFQQLKFKGEQSNTNVVDEKELQIRITKLTHSELVLNNSKQRVTSPLSEDEEVEELLNQFVERHQLDSQITSNSNDERIKYQPQQDDELLERFRKLKGENSITNRQNETSRKSNSFEQFVSQILDEQRLKKIASHSLNNTIQKKKKREIIVEISDESDETSSDSSTSTSTSTSSSF